MTFWPTKSQLDKMKKLKTALHDSIQCSWKKNRIVQPCSPVSYVPYHIGLAFLVGMHTSCRGLVDGSIDHISSQLHSSVLYGSVLTQHLAWHTAASALSLSHKPGTIKTKEILISWYLKKHFLTENYVYLQISCHISYLHAVVGKWLRTLGHCVVSNYEFLLVWFSFTMVSALVWPQIYCCVLFIRKWLFEKEFVLGFLPNG